MLYKGDLDNMQCDACGDSGVEKLYLHPRCHLRSPLWVEYSDGIITATCAECGKHVTSIAVASEDKYTK